MFTAKPYQPVLSAWPLRWLALGCVLLVGMLSLAAVSPEIHAALHGHSPAQDGHSDPTEHAGTQTETGHSCAVTLFSQGIESGCAPVLVLGAPEPLFTDVIVLADQVAKAARATQLPPGRGPPVC